MDNKRNLEITTSTEGEPTHKTLKINPLALKDSFSKTVPQGVKCLICAGVTLSSTRTKTQIFQANVSLLGKLFEVLKLSPEVCRRLLKSPCSTANVLYCETCKRDISSCLKISQEIENLQSAWEQISTKIRENITSDHHCRLDSPGNAYIRRTLMQYFGISVTANQDKGEEKELLSGVSSSPRSCQEQIVNYFCDVNMEENTSESGLEDAQDDDKILCQNQDQQGPILDGKPQSTKKMLKKPLTKKPERVSPSFNSPIQKPISSVSTSLRMSRRNRLQEFPFNCSICGKGYHRKTSLKLHEKAHDCSGSLPLSCSKCKDLRFISDSSLIRHNAMCHENNSDPHTSKKATKVSIVEETKVNGSTLDESDPDPHVPETLHGCKKCSLTFEDVTALRKHTRSDHVEKNISCPECIEKFASVTTARNHQIRIHGKSLETTFNDEESLDSFQCVYCSEEFVKSSFIIEDNSTDPPTKKFSFPDLPPLVSRSISDHVANSETIDFKSFHWNHRKFCKSRPRIESVWDKQDVPDPAENTCKFCQKEFANVDRCRNHEITVHTKDFKFHCDICGRPCPDKVSLRSHRHSVHSERRYKCDQCPKIFKQNFELKNHMNTHSNIRSFICEHCGKGYCTRNVLWMHKKQSHKNYNKT